MAKLAQKHIIAINKLMLATTASYIKTFVRDDADISSMQMYADDVAHNVSALHVFNSTKNAQQLHDNIMRQDTLVREYYIETLRYIENNNLIPDYMFCCV